jgi:hypothetical protein
LDHRLRYLSNDKITIDNLFERSYKKEGIDYIIDRTYMRPRALISFVNKIIEQADRKSQFTHSLIKSAEPFYSTERLHAIDDEWTENYGQVSKMCGFLYGKNVSIEISSITENDLKPFILMIVFAKILREDF